MQFLWDVLLSNNGKEASGLDSGDDNNSYNGEDTNRGADISISY
jgi:hypothetical protein